MYSGQESYGLEETWLIGRAHKTHPETSSVRLKTAENSKGLANGTILLRSSSPSFFHNLHYLVEFVLDFRKPMSPHTYPSINNETIQGTKQDLQ